MEYLDDIADYLQSLGIGTVATDIFVSYLPDSPTNAVGLTDETGEEPDHDLPTDSPNFQVTVRNQNVTGGRAKLRAIRNALEPTSMKQIGSTFFMYILAMNEGGHVGRDDTGRDIFTMSFRCKVR